MADLELSIAFHVASTSKLPHIDLKNHQRHSNIFEARGCVVHGEAFRIGHRSLRLDGKRLGSARVKSYQKKESFRVDQYIAML